jgi:hypothetical protein
MKKIVLLLLAFTAITLQAQTPDMINYQAAIKNDAGQPLANHMVTVQMTITTSGGSSNHTMSGITNDFGILNLQIGGPELKGIDWSKGNASVDIDVTTDDGTIDMGSVAIATVPYALYAESSGSSIPGPPPSQL